MEKPKRGRLEGRANYQPGERYMDDSDRGCAGLVVGVLEG